MAAAAVGHRAGRGTTVERVDGAARPARRRPAGLGARRRRDRATGRARSPGSPPPPLRRGRERGAGGPARRGRRGGLGRCGLLERRRRGQPRARGRWGSARRRRRAGSGSRSGATTTDADIDRVLDRRAGRGRPAARLKPCGCWWPCPAGSTPRSPPRWSPSGSGREQVVGATLKLWGGPSDSGCCSVADVEDARRVADQLGLVHHVFNFSAEFEEHVVDPYVSGPRRGSHPQPVHRVQPAPQVRPVARAGPRAGLRRGGHRAPRPVRDRRPAGASGCAGGPTRRRTSPTCWPCSARTSWPAPSSRSGR